MSAWCLQISLADLSDLAELLFEKTSIVSLAANLTIFHYKKTIRQYWPYSVVNWVYFKWKKKKNMLNYFKWKKKKNMLNWNIVCVLFSLMPWKPVDLHYLSKWNCPGFMLTSFKWCAIAIRTLWKKFKSLWYTTKQSCFTKIICEI